MLGRLPIMTHICRVAKLDVLDVLDALSVSVPGRPGMTAEAAELTAAREEVMRLRATRRRSCGRCSMARSATAPPCLRRCRCGWR
jgi:hypothetical protein